MPEMHFHLRWPDGREAVCYSPSLVVREHLSVGTGYPVAEFQARVSTALQIASDRVRAKYGFACSRAMDELARIEAETARFATQPGATVQVLRFDPQDAP